MLWQASGSAEPIFLFSAGSDTLLGMVSAQGKIISAPKYTYWQMNSDGLIFGFSPCDSCEHIDVYDATGNVLLSDLGAYEPFVGESGSALIQPLANNTARKFQIVNLMGRALTKLVYDSIYAQDNWWDHSHVKKGDFHQWIDPNGKVVCSAKTLEQYEQAVSKWFQEKGKYLGGGLGGIGLGGGGSQSPEEATTLPPKPPVTVTADSLAQTAAYDSVCQVLAYNDHVTDWAVVRKGDLFGLYNLKQKIIAIEPRYTHLIPAQERFLNFCSQD